MNIEESITNLADVDVEISPDRCLFGASYINEDTLMLLLELFVDDVDVDVLDESSSVWLPRFRIEFCVNWIRK